MIGSHELILAVSDSSGANLRLFQESPGAASAIVGVVFFGGLVLLLAVGLLRHLRAKRLEKLPAVLGDPQSILDPVAGLIGLSGSDRHLLARVAFRMRLPQPMAILLSPALLAEAGRVWTQTHRFSPTRRWGLDRLDHIARRVFGKSLADLAQHADQEIS